MLLPISTIFVISANVALVTHTDAYNHVQSQEQSTNTIFFVSRSMLDPQVDYVFENVEKLSTRQYDTKHKNTGRKYFTLYIPKELPFY